MWRTEPPSWKAPPWRAWRDDAGAEEHLQNLHPGQAGRASAEGHLSLCGRGRVCGHYGSLRLGQNHPDEYHWLLGQSHLGEYLLEGKDIAQNSDSKLSDVRLHSIGFVFQSFYLLSRQSALDNVALPLLYAGVRRKERQAIAQKALERVGLGDRIHFKPTQLSGGQCQRVAIARAIVNNPKVLLADEPTGALDTKSGEQIMEIFQKLNEEGVTIVMITHEPEIAAHARRVLHIRDGRLLEAQPTATPAGSAPAESGAVPAKPSGLGEGVIPAEEFHIARKKPAKAPQAPKAPARPPVREALPVQRKPRQPAILIECSLPLRQDLRNPQPAVKEGTARMPKPAVQPVSAQAQAVPAAGSRKAAADISAAGGSGDRAASGGFQAAPAGGLWRADPHRPGSAVSPAEA